ncbi:MAG: hypothetical protein R3E51_20050 [Rhizobiaceae bacterium]|jgi:hypothetical protein
MMLVRLLCCCMGLAMASAASADELSDRVCPILKTIASGMAGKADYAVQAELVMEIGGAYDFDGEKLRDVTANLDASTSETCPDSRSAILRHLSMNSLEQAVR